MGTGRKERQSWFFFLKYFNLHPPKQLKEITGLNICVQAQLAPFLKIYILIQFLLTQQLLFLYFLSASFCGITRFTLHYASEGKNTVC